MPPKTSVNDKYYFSVWKIFRLRVWEKYIWDWAFYTNNILFCDMLVDAKLKSYHIPVSVQILHDVISICILKNNIAHIKTKIIKKVSVIS